MTDIEIAQNATMLPIGEVAAKLGLSEADYEMYGKYKAKITSECMERLKDKPDGRLVLVTAINPTPAGEGKTTTSVGLADAFQKLNKKAMLAIREPSLGPCFGMKGGAAGGGYAQVVPMEDLNLHLPEIFMPLRLQITFWRLWWIIISIRGMNCESTPDRFFGKDVSI